MSGPTGSTGSTGREGKTGATGENHPRAGRQGPKGQRGVKGPRGFSNGINGFTGATGQNGMTFSWVFDILYTNSSPSQSHPICRYSQANGCMAGLTTQLGLEYLIFSFADLFQSIFFQS